MRGETFIGWIPNVAGRLSFSHIGASDFPRKCLKTNAGNANGRRIVVAQRRKLSDWLLPDWYFRYLYRFSSDWVFVLVAETASDKFDQIARVEGEVFVFERHAWENLSDQVGAATLRTFVTQDLFDWAREPAQPEQSSPDSALQRLRCESLFAFCVKIRRSGVLWMHQTYVATDIQFSDGYAGDGGRGTLDDLMYIANQAFFFLKDISHKHQHHHNSSDTITELGRLDRRNSWVTQTHYRIHRKVIEMRRSNDPKKLYNASGILAYLSALRKAADFTALGKRRGPLTYNNSDIEISLKSSLEVMKWKQTQSNIIKTALPAITIALIGVLGYDEGSVGLIVRDYINESLNRHPARWVALFAIVGFSAPFYYGVQSFSDLGLVVHAKRILVTLPRQLHGTLWILGATLFAVLAFIQPQMAEFSKQIIMRAGLDVNLEFASWIALASTAGVSALGLASLPILATIGDLANRVGEDLMSGVHWALQKIAQS